MKVAILGTAPGFERAFDGDYDEYWGLNDLYTRLKRRHQRKITRWFELHGDTPLTRSRRPPDHWDELAALHLPVYTFFDLPDGILAQPFPIADDIAAGKDYFACTFAYQIGLALSEGVTALGMYGTPLCGTPREALVERPCVEWWLGLATGRGVRVCVDHDQPIGLGRHPHRYAMDDQKERRASCDYAWTVIERGIGWLIHETMRLAAAESENPLDTSMAQM